MFPVKGQLAAAVAVGRGFGVRPPRPAAEVDDLSHRGEIDGAAVGAHGCTEIHILAIHEIALVEQPRRFFPALNRFLQGVWPDGEPPAHALTQDGGIQQPNLDLGLPDLKPEASVL